MPVVVKDLSYIYNPGSPFEKAALENISMTIEDGDFFGIIGHTGSGKSTLIGHFNALIKLKSGQIFINDIDLSKKYDYKKLRSTVGMVFQYPEYQLFADSVKKDVQFGPKNLGIKGEELEQRAREAIELVGLSYAEIAERSPFELSGGQMRRVALAGVIAMQPKILILDEPTAGLDPQGKKEILELLLKIKAKMCPTIIMISHNMDEIAAYCNRIAVLSFGRLEGIFSPRELFRKESLIESLHLEPPLVTKIARELSHRGIAVDQGVLNSDELSDIILELYSKKIGGAEDA